MSRSVNDSIRAIVTAPDSGFLSVEFLKKDGTRRTIVTSARHGKKYLPDIMSPSAYLAAQTRAKNNPDLVNVWSVLDYIENKKKGMTESEAGRKAWRSFDLNRVLSVASNGKRHVFRIVRPLATEAPHPMLTG